MVFSSCDITSEFWEKANVQVASIKTLLKGQSLKRLVPNTKLIPARDEGRADWPLAVAKQASPWAWAQYGGDEDLDDVTPFPYNSTEAM